MRVAGKGPRPFWKTIWNYLGKLNIHAVDEPAAPLLGTLQRNSHTGGHRRAEMLPAALAEVREVWENPAAHQQANHGHPRTHWGGVQPSDGRTAAARASLGHSVEPEDRALGNRTVTTQTQNTGALLFKGGWGGEFIKC